MNIFQKEYPFYLRTTAAILFTCLIFPAANVAAQATKSATEKSMEKQKDLVKEYIEKIENVESKEEFDKLRKECNERLDFEDDKLTIWEFCISTR